MSLPLTRQDLTDEENRRDCLAALKYARDLSLAPRTHALGVWAEKWVEALDAFLTDPGGPTDDDLAQAQNEATELEEAKLRLEGVIEDAIAAMDAASEMKSEPRAAAYEKIAADLEKAITE